ncbi:MAG TPA: hypothetical protein VK147_12890 [Candidatus Didemnitutus sp.]|nr:hypothetical protein [Candidatus Didemnitutus sp.]
MITDRTIHDYLEGALTSDEEARLFTELAGREDLRNELTTQIQLHAAVRKDYGAVVVPLDSTQSIFGELGLPLPSTFGTPMVRSSSFIQDHLGAVMFIALPLLFLASISLHQNADLPLSLHGVARQNVRVVADPSTARAISSKTRNKTSRRVGRPIEPPPPALLSEETLVSRAMPIDYEEGSIEVLHPVTEELPRSLLNVPRHSTDEQHRSKIDITLRSMALAASTPDPELAEPNTMMPFALGVQYRLDDEHAIGVDGGYESFPQAYSRTVNGQTEVYRQAPSLWWVGATYRYSATGLRIADAITPIVSGTIAYTTVGPLIRSTIGVLVTPESRLSILFGIEGTALFYPIQSQFYSTRTLQLTYGISYRF